MTLQVLFWLFNQDKKKNKKKLETKNVLVNGKNYKDLIIYFTWYDFRKSIRMFSLFYLELMGKIEENKEKYLMACD